MNLQKIINFEIKNILVEFKTKFDLRKFKSIDNLEDKINYIKINLEKLGEGTARTTFLLSSKTVIKLAKPKFPTKGVEQNKSEVRVYQNIKDKSIITKIYDYDPNYFWIMSELVRPVKSREEFKKLTNISADVFKDIMYDISYGHILYNQSLEKNILNKLTLIYKNNSIEKLKLLNNNFLHKVIFLIEDFNLNATDLGKYFHLGKSADNTVVLLDYGFTEEQRKSNI